MTPFTDDTARQSILAQLDRQEPGASKLEYPNEEWIREFERPWMLQGRAHLEQPPSTYAFCRMCVVEKKHGKLLAYKLHVTIGPDPMQVAKHGILTLQCFNCDFVIVAAKKPPVEWGKGVMDAYAQFDQKSLSVIEQRMRQYEAQRQLAQANMPNLTQEAMRKMVEDYQNTMFAPGNIVKATAPPPRQVGKAEAIRRLFGGKGPPV